MAALPLEIDRHASVKRIRALDHPEAPRLVEAHQPRLQHQQELEAAEAFGDRHRRFETGVPGETLQIADGRKGPLGELQPEGPLVRRARRPGRATADAFDRQVHSRALDQPVQQQLGPRIGLLQAALRRLHIEKIQQGWRDARQF